MDNRLSETCLYWIKACNYVNAYTQDMQLCQLLKMASIHELLHNRNLKGGSQYWWIIKHQLMLMDYKISPTKCSLSVKDACLYPIAAFPYHSWSSTGTVCHEYFIIAASGFWFWLTISNLWLGLLQVAGLIFRFSHECWHVTITRTFIYALLTPIYTKESHNLCTKDTACTFHL